MGLSPPTIGKSPSSHVDSPVIATHEDSKSPHRHLVKTAEGVCEVVCESVCVCAEGVKLCVKVCVCVLRVCVMLCAKVCVCVLRV